MRRAARRSARGAQQTGRAKPAATKPAARRTPKRAAQPTPSPGGPRVPLRAVAALFIERQWLDRPRGRSLDAASLEGFAASTGGVQIDTINVLDRAHHLTLWSRFGPYDRSRLDRLIYGERALFEYWSHAACFVPRSHAGPWRRAMHDYGPSSTAWGRWIKRNARVIQRLEAAVRESGPLGNGDMREDRPRGSEGWWNWKPSAHAFHVLWMQGRLLVHERKHFQKRYDLAERVLPELETLDLMPRPEFLRWHVLQSLSAMGAASEVDLRMYMTFPRMAYGERRRALQQLVHEGEVVELRVEGQRAPWYARAADVPALEAAASTSAPGGSTLLSPFDSLLWHRERVRALFGFDYRIEVYTPGHKRVHGYYTLPLYVDGRLVGRLDAKNHRSEKRLEIHAVHFEPWLVRGGAPAAPGWPRVEPEAAIEGLGEAVESLARFLGAETVTVSRAYPAKLAAAIRRRLKASAGALRGA